MKPSPPSEVQAMYDSSAEVYAQMMDAEIESPVYLDHLRRLSASIEGVVGPLLDTSCGSGHMLDLYHRQIDSSRQLMGVDLSERMIEIASERLADHAELVLGDMRKLDFVASGTASAVISFFALHHLSAEDSIAALCEWHRTLRNGGQLLIASWHGEGKIDFGGSFDVTALMIKKDDLKVWVQTAGFEVSKCEIAPVDDMPMDAVYLEAIKK